MPAQVTVSTCEKLQQEVATESGTLLVDEPASLGGDGAGPNPYELILAALGACTNMTLQLYARRKGWQLDAIETHLSHQRVHATDCADCEKSENFLDRFDKEIVVDGELDDEQLNRLLQIAERCPVNQTLLHGVKSSARIRRAGEGI